MKKKKRSAVQILKILQEIDASQAQGSTVENRGQGGQTLKSDYILDNKI